MVEWILIVILFSEGSKVGEVISIERDFRSLELCREAGRSFYMKNSRTLFSCLPISPPQEVRG